MTQPVYKYREDTLENIKVGVVNDKGEVIFNSPNASTLNNLDVSLYHSKFWIVVEGEYLGIIPSNKEELGEIITGAEGINYTLGYIKDGIFIFYDQYL